MAENEEEPEGFGHAVTNKSALNYVDDVLVASTNLVWLHWLFGMTIGLFDRLGLWTNMESL